MSGTHAPTTTPTRAPTYYEMIMANPLLQAGIASGAVITIAILVYAWTKRRDIHKVAIETFYDDDYFAQKERQALIEEKLNVIKGRKANKISKFLEKQQEREEKMKAKTEAAALKAKPKPKPKVSKLRDKMKEEGKEIFKSSKPAKRSGPGTHHPIHHRAKIASEEGGESDLDKAWSPDVTRKRSFQLSVEAISPIDDMSKEEAKDANIDDDEDCDDSTIDTTADVMSRMQIEEVISIHALSIYYYAIFLCSFKNALMNV